MSIKNHLSVFSFVFALCLLASSCSDSKNGVCPCDGDTDSDPVADGDDLSDGDDDTETDGEGSVDGDVEVEQAPQDEEHLAFIPDWQLQRQLDYLEFACAEPLKTGSMTHLLMHLECEQRLPDFSVAANVVPEDAYDGVFSKLWRLRDTSDFDASRMLNLIYAHRGHAAVPEALWRKMEQSLRDFKYWFTDPTPERVVDEEPVVDVMWYWSENHVLIFRVNEYLAGQYMPDDTFSVTGLTGREHMARARVEIDRWLDERAHWGFSEWHSNVYYNWDMQPLLHLVEWSEDRELAKRAAMVLDLFWLDVALHLHRGAFGATHGRSYIKDKAAASLEDTFNGSLLFFEDSELPFTSIDSSNASVFARARRYQLPWVIRSIARHDEPMIDRERMNLPLDERPPEAFDDPIPAPPYGVTYTEEYLPLWWSMSGFLAWPLLPLTFEMAKTYNLWEGPFEMLAVLGSIIDLEQPTEGVMADVYPLYKLFWRVIGMGLLREVHTYTYRSENYMLSSIQDYRAGSMANQVHPWQATLSEKALVFTQHPAYLPVAEGDPIQEDWNWQKEDEPGPGYWTGEGSMPRIAQYENLALIIYAPQFAPKPLGLTQFDYRDETHAYFPQAHFDETLQKGNWTCGSKDKAYLALYSYRDVSWRVGQPEVYQNGDLPFDLVAAGGPDNAWIAELGDKDQWESLEAFCTAASSAELSVTPLEDQDDDGYDDGYDITYQSPSQGEVSFGWHAPFKVAGEEAPLSWDWRFDNPFVKTTFNDSRYEISNGDDYLLLDFEKGRRGASEAPRVE